MDFDIAIVGAGPGGYETALYAARCGFKVALIERDKVGGTCLNYGCIPTKIMLATAKKIHAMDSLEGFGIHVSKDNIRLSYQDVIARKESILAVQRKSIQALLDKAGVVTYFGTAVFSAENVLSVNNELLSAKDIILATGTAPANMGLFQIDHEKVLSSDDMLDLSVLPASLIIVGGGVMGSEFAFIFRQFGVEITLIEQQPTILPLEDHEISTTVTREMKKQGIHVATDVTLTELLMTSSGVNLKTSEGKVFSSEKILLTVGRKKQTDQLGLGSLGIYPQADGSLFINDYMQTELPHLFAIGDITGKKMLAHVATAQGRVVIDYLKGKTPRINYQHIPAAIFTMPEVASVGLTEQAAATQGLPYEVKKFLYRNLGKAHVEGEIVGLFKFVIHRQSHHVLGAHIMGERASDIIMEAAIAIENGLSYQDLERVIHPHPTYAEGVRLCLEML